jgi:beta-N-acetylhexosaminidase
MKILSRFTLEEKVGQLFFLGFRGSMPDLETQGLLDVIRPGGLVLSQRNIDTFDQINELTGNWTDRREIPALVGISQEGGPADRLKQLFQPLPSMSEVAAGGVTQIRVLARLIAAELESLGINTLFGPVLDLSTPGSILRERTLASMPREVSRLGGAFMEEVSQKGIRVCPKHFPGLGAAQRDPHFGLPTIDKPRKQLLREDVLPFMDLLNVPLVMISHAYYPALMDSTPSPASLSSRVIDGFLRRKLRFSGVVITDDMTMGAIGSMGLTPERFLEAFEAGNDMLLFSETTPLVERAFRAMLGEAKRSPAFRGRLDRSVGRILALKQTLAPAIRNRAQVRTRVIRQIHRFDRTVTQQVPRSPVAS